MIRYAARYSTFVIVANVDSKHWSMFPDEPSISKVRGEPLETAGFVDDELMAQLVEEGHTIVDLDKGDRP